MMRRTRLRHAVTIAANQCKTLEVVVRVWDVHSKHFDTTHRDVACSGCLGEMMHQFMCTPPRIARGSSA